MVSNLHPPAGQHTVNRSHSDTARGHWKTHFPACRYFDGHAKHDVGDGASSPAQPRGQRRLGTPATLHLRATEPERAATPSQATCPSLDRGETQPCKARPAPASHNKQAVKSAGRAQPWEAPAKRPGLSGLLGKGERDPTPGAANPGIPERNRMVATSGSKVSPPPCSGFHGYVAYSYRAQRALHSHFHTIELLLQAGPGPVSGAQQ